MSQSDLLHRFIFTHAEDEYAPGTPQASYAGGARGELVQLDTAWQSILSRSDYPPAVARLLGETAVAAVLLAATLKIDGKLTLQVQGEGTVHLLVMQVTSPIRRERIGTCDAGASPQGDGQGWPASERELRGLARWHGEVEGEGLALMGDGRLVMTIETARGERYQGIVPLEGASLAQALEGYFARSEQLPTRLWLEAGPERAAGLLVQKLPGHESARDDEDWSRIVALSETITRDELLDLPAETLLHRLYHEEDRRVFDPERVAFACSCSRERVAEMLRSLGKDEVEDILAEQGKIEVHCEFCNAGYTFDSVDAAALFVESPHPGAQGLH